MIRWSLKLLVVVVLIVPLTTLAKEVPLSIRLTAQILPKTTAAIADAGEPQEVNLHKGDSLAKIIQRTCGTLDPVYTGILLLRNNTLTPDDLLAVRNDTTALLPACALAPEVSFASSPRSILFSKEKPTASTDNAKDIVENLKHVLDMIIQSGNDSPQTRLELAQWYRWFNDPSGRLTIAKPQNVPVLTPVWSTVDLRPGIDRATAKDRIRSALSEDFSALSATAAEPGGSGSNVWTKSYAWNKPYSSDNAWAKSYGNETYAWDKPYSNGSDWTKSYGNKIYAWDKSDASGADPNTCLFCYTTTPAGGTLSWLGLPTMIFGAENAGNSGQSTETPQLPRTPESESPADNIDDAVLASLVTSIDEKDPSKVGACYSEVTEDPWRWPFDLGRLLHVLALERRIGSSMPEPKTVLVIDTGIDKSVLNSRVFSNDDIHHIKVLRSRSSPGVRDDATTIGVNVASYQDDPSTPDGYEDRFHGLMVAAAALGGAQTLSLRPLMPPLTQVSFVSVLGTRDKTYRNHRYRHRPGPSDRSGQRYPNC
jgi:hypothetical protein